MNIISDKVKKFTEIYTSFYPLIFNGIYSRIRNEDISGELAQEVFTRFYEKIDEVEQPRKWLLGALRFVLLEYYKKNSHYSIDIEEVLFDTNIQYTNGFRDTRLILQDAFDATENYNDETERVIYNMVAIQNYTYEEVAGLLGMTKRQINYRYRLVVDRIIDYLKKRGIKNLEELL